MKSRQGWRGGYCIIVIDRLHRHGALIDYSHAPWYTHGSFVDYIHTHPHTYDHTRVISLILQIACYHRAYANKATHPGSASPLSLGHFHCHHPLCLTSSW